jgi:hypothetical protein
LAFGRVNIALALRIKPAAGVSAAAWDDTVPPVSEYRLKTAAKPDFVKAARAIDQAFRR